MATTVIRAREPRELLAYVPHRLGFSPTDSLAAIAVRARPSRLGLVVRVDIADLASEASGDDVAATVSRHLHADGARRVVLVLYTDEDRREVRRGRGAAGQALSRVRAVLGDDVVADVWLVSSTGYAGVDCQDDACCPEMGRSLTDLESTQVGAQMVLEGSVVAPSRDALAVRRRAPEPARRAARRAAAAERDRRPGQALRDGWGDQESIRSAWTRRGLANWADLLRRAAAGRDLPAGALGRLLAGLEDVLLRDAVILEIVRAGGAAAERDSVTLVAVFGSGGPTPDRSAVASARAVLEAVVAHAAVSRGGPPLAVLAWLAWWTGDGARARVLVEQCLGVDPGYSLAGLMGEILDAGLPPGWARGVG